MIINKKMNNKKIIIIVVLVILLFLITIIIRNVHQSKKQQEFIEQEIRRVKQYTALTDFKSIDEVALYLDYNLIKQEESQTEGITYDIYIELPNNNSDNNKSFIENLIQYNAYALKYKNFIIIDKKNNLNIVVICNESLQQVEKYSINNIENYFDVQETLKNIENFSNIEPIDVQITSDELNQIVSNNWRTNNIQIGTIESSYRKYDIYFDEGFQIRKIDGKVFNIVFTDKYQKSIINDLKVSSSTEEIKNKLGKPHFETNNIVGYKAKNLYIFFCNNQISVYRNEEFETEKFAEIIEKYKSSTDVKSFVKEVKDIWTDYDLYDYNSDYVKIRYALKGVMIKYDYTTKKGIILYNNYNGKILRK